MRSFIICTHPQVRWVERVVRMGRRENCARFRWENSKERGHSEDQGVDERMGTEWILGKLSGGVWSGFSWLRIGTGGGLLGTRC
jgi:hypothetical protein